MAIFNESSIDILLAFNEKKTHETYARESFKRKYNFVPDGPSGVGTITVQGKKHDINMNSKSLGCEDGVINLNKRFFNLDGAHGGERRDAILQHEIGHKSLQSAKTDPDIVDTRNRSKSLFRREVAKDMKSRHNIDISKDPKAAARVLCKESPRLLSVVNRIQDDNKAREFIYHLMGEDEYLKDTSKEDQDRRDSDYMKAKKYEKSNTTHTKAEEFEADRYAANRTSERALRKGLTNNNKLAKKDKNLSADPKEVDIDLDQRRKALKDKDLQDAKTYK